MKVLIRQCLIGDFIESTVPLYIWASSREKKVFEVSEKASLLSWKIEISPVASLHMILSTKLITKAFIRQLGCIGWSAPVLFANPQKQVFSRLGPFGLEYRGRRAFISSFLFFLMLQWFLNGKMGISENIWCITKAVSG